MISISFECGKAEMERWIEWMDGPEELGLLMA